MVEVLQKGNYFLRRSENEVTSGVSNTLEARGAKHLFFSGRAKGTMKKTQLTEVMIVGTVK